MSDETFDLSSYQDADARNEALIRYALSIYHAERNAYRRPEKGFAGLLSKPLGRMTDTVKIHPTKEALTTVPNLHLAAFGLMVAAIGLLIAISSYGPAWLKLSPLVLYTGFYADLFGVGVVYYIACVATFMLLAVALQHGMESSSGYQGKFLNRAAMNEEQWFRNGAENWSWQQRLYSCCAFGIVHVTNIIYPISSLLVVGAVGGVYLRYYLRVYRRTGDSQYATLAATKLHANFNRWAILYLVAAFTVIIWL